MFKDPVEYSAAALLDIELILQYTDQRWGSEQSAHYAVALESACKRLGSYPEPGPSLTRFEDRRSLIVEHHRIVYRVVPTGVLILRVVHQKMRLSDIELP